MRPRRIGIIGRIDPQGTLVDGQTVKTRTLYRCMVDHFGAARICPVDTLRYRHQAVRVSRELVRCLLSCDDIVVLLSNNGRRVFFPLLSLMARVFDKRIYHNLIGGTLADDVAGDPSGRLASYLNSFRVNWVESRSLAARLHDLGVRNASYLPNFKALGDVAVNPSFDRQRPHRLCMFSRVTAVKGVDNAVRAVEAINRTAQSPVVTLDIFGPVDDSYEQEFRALVDRAPSVRYRGRVPAEDSVRTISPYYALIFPTEWIGEGVPGTIIDAMHASVPVVASRWRYYSEMLEDGATGLSYDFDQPALLEETLLRFIALPPETIESMRREIHTRSTAYSVEAVFDQIALTVAQESR